MDLCKSTKLACCLFAALVLCVAVPAVAQTTSTNSTTSPTWPQWGLNSQHSLFDAGVVGQPLNQNAVNLIYDFNVAAEQADPNAAGTLVVYANSEDGNLYAISQGGTMLQRIFQQLAIGAAYTPASLDSSGRIYSQNDGHLFIVTK